MLNLVTPVLLLSVARRGYMCVCVGERKRKRLEARSDAPGTKSKCAKVKSIYKVMDLEGPRSYRKVRSSIYKAGTSAIR